MTYFLTIDHGWNESSHEEHATKREAKASIQKWLSKHGRKTINDIDIIRGKKLDAAEFLGEKDAKK